MQKEGVVIMELLSKSEISKAVERLSEGITELEAN